MPNAYDVIVVGGGHNGLVAAGYLARAGASVLVLEQRPTAGGLAVTEELYPGFWVDTVLHSASTLRPGIIRDLFLKMHAFAFAPAGTQLFTPLPDGRQLTLVANPAGNLDTIRTFSANDATRYPDYCDTIARYATFIEAALSRIPPNLSQLGSGDLFTWLGLGKALPNLGPGLGIGEIYGLLRILPMSLVEWFDEWFEHGLVRAALGAPGVLAIQQGPRSGGTAFGLLYQLMGQPTTAGRPQPGIVRGGIGQLTAALVAAARQFGAEIRTNTPVAHLRLANGQANGVVLANGDELAARAVLSTTNPRHTFTQLVDPFELDPSFNRAVSNIKFRGAVAKVNLALDTLPQFAALPAGETTPLQGRIQIAPGLMNIERAYDAAKYGQFSTRPYLEIVIPTLHAPHLAPAGKHTMSILVQYAPYNLRNTTWEQQREPLGDTVINTLAEYIPNLRDIILHRQVLTPLDLEQQYGLAEGSLYHGEMTLDQLLFMRPVPGWAQYRTPIPGLYFGGSGAHPGGGITGEPGRMAARELLHDLKQG
ncbi:MAG: NAD(P)/FAD-dependent oxidoreductase [Ardenticatenaceae bacterium]|nr:NAD(P)/FAD-dependent oxidoreductase [Ardenticatenaceae bacterium]